MYCPNRYKYLEDLSQLDNWALSSPRSGLAVVRALNRVLGKRIAVKWRLAQHRVPKNTSMVSACYDPVGHEYGDDTYIEGIVSISIKGINWNKNTWLDFKRIVADTMCHEKIHAHQYRIRRFRAIPYNWKTSLNDREKSYYGHPDEIDCYAHNVAAEMLDYYGRSVDDAFKRWKEIAIIQPPKAPSIHLWCYYNVFGSTNVKVMKTLVARAKEYLVEIKRQQLIYTDDI